MASKLDIPLHGASLNIVRRCGPALEDILQNKFGCIPIIEGVDFEREPSTAQKRPTVVPERRFSATLPSGVVVSVWKADLTNFSADAVVNAANTQLQHYGGLALALSDVGGPQIQKESDDYIRRYGNLKTGDAIVTDAGHLPCMKIIHAVGPHLSNNPMSDLIWAEPQLKRAINSILDRVREYHLQSVAIPAISSGLFHYPLPECANTVVTAVKHYYERSHGPLPREILLVNNDEPSVKEMHRACQQILGHQVSMTYSQAAASNSRGKAKTSATAVQIGNVHLTLKKGKIEEQRTDVIVNTASSNRDLSIGEISKALLKKAGSKMQQEVYSAPPSGRVIMTNAYNLQCKKVYHTFCTEKGTHAWQNTEAQKILFNSVLECLWLAVTEDHKSIAFPAIGTGALGFARKEVAQIMSHAVSDFAQKCPKKIEVYFVIFPSDNDTFQAFEEHLRFLQQRVSHPSFSLAFEQTEDVHGSRHREDVHGSRAPRPQISLRGPSEEATREAERWLQDLLFQSAGTVVICNNFIQHFGEQEHLQLSRLSKKGVSIEEFFEKGRASVFVHGDSIEDVVVAGLQVEAILCKIQKEFVREEERAMLLASTQNVLFERQTLQFSSPELKDRLSLLRGLRTLKVEKVVNPTLQTLFDLKRQQLHCFTSQTMFQRIPAQFCEMVSHIGFHAEYAPPEDPAYGEGIYFAASVEKAMEVWKGQNEEYVYFVEAEVLTGTSTPGKPGLILPPPRGTDPHILYDSVSGGPDVSVIFSGYQALPRYIITCKVA